MQALTISRESAAGEQKRPAYIRVYGITFKGISTGWGQGNYRVKMAIDAVRESHLLSQTQNPISACHERKPSYIDLINVGRRNFQCRRFTQIDCFVKWFCLEDANVYQDQNSALGGTIVSSASLRKRNHWFYTGSAFLMLLVMLIGFQSFYLRGMAYPGREIPPPIRTLVFIHGFAMSGWVLLYVAQTLLIAAKRPRIHMALGRFAALFAIGLVVSGLLLSIQSTRIAPPEMVIWGMSAKQFLTVPLISILLFGAMVGIGIWFRLKPDIHRPMMLFATLSALGAATSRIDFLNGMYQSTPLETVFGPFFFVLIIGALLVAVKCALTYTFDKWFALSYGLVLVVFLLLIQLAKTSQWDQIASLLLMQ